MINKIGGALFRSIRKLPGVFNAIGRIPLPMVGGRKGRGGVYGAAPGSPSSLKLV